VRRLGREHAVSLSVTRAQRAPATEELYSFGAHHATASFDIGDPALAKEVSRNVDLAFRKTHGALRWKVNLFHNRIRDYVFAASQDADADGIADRVDEEGELDPEGEFLVQRFTQGRATFRGIEAEASYRFPDGTGLRLFADTVRARLSDGTSLPRMAPARIGAEVESRRGPWSAALRVLRAMPQKRTAPLETPTAGYTRLDGEVAWNVATGEGRRVIVFVQGRNLLDREMRLHTSHLKDVAPQIGRSFTLGVRGEF
jgi:iron complex outermembrane receptor protein